MTILRVSASVIALTCASAAVAQTAAPEAPPTVVAPQAAITPPVAQNGRPQVRELTADELAELRDRMVRQSGAQILSPSDIGVIRDRVIAADGAARLGTDTPPQARARVLTITPAVATAAPDQLNLAFGIVTPVTFTDAANRPWPVASVAYDPRMFAESGAGCGGGNGSGSSGLTDRPSTVNLMPCRVDTWGNVSIQLESYPWPIVLMARSGAREPIVDVPVTVRITKSGASPLAASGVTGLPAPTTAIPKMPMVGVPKSPSGIDDSLIAFAAGTPPANAYRIRVTGDGDVQAWLFRDQLYLRGRVALINPVHEATADRDDIHVWRLAPTSRVLVAREDGTEVALTLAY